MAIAGIVSAISITFYGAQKYKPDRPPVLLETAQSKADPPSADWKYRSG